MTTGRINQVTLLSAVTVQKQSSTYANESLFPFPLTHIGKCFHSPEREVLTKSKILGDPCTQALASSHVRVPWIFGSFKLSLHERW